ncbi:gp261 [Sphingomonas phage PAU]|uniref:gp261 n=1 Tax=Sphingomonas phage PAU TaxID=1150991 RepID=UPI000257340B|nr:gp261 [Sphingomonas phage PAU]AFF28259.1 gp261 [Sphingomonas phage PAU]
MDLLVIRDLATDNETLGKLYIDGKFFCYTLEDVSRPVKLYGDTCIPYDDNYKVKTTNSPRFGRPLPLVWNNSKDESVTNRNGDRWSGIRFHGGNHHMHTLGCLLVAKNRYDNKPTKFDYKGKTYTFDNWIQGSMIDPLVAKLGKNTSNMKIVLSDSFKDLRTINTDKINFSFKVNELDNSDTLKIKNALIKHGYPIEDSKFDWVMQEYVYMFQKANGINPNGIVNKETMTALGLLWDDYELVEPIDHLKIK